MVVNDSVSQMFRWPCFKTTTCHPKLHRKSLTHNLQQQQFLMLKFFYEKKKLEIKEKIKEREIFVSFLFAFHQLFFFSLFLLPFVGAKSNQEPLNS